MDYLLNINLITNKSFNTRLVIMIMNEALAGFSSIFILIIDLSDQSSIGLLSSPNTDRDQFSWLTNLVDSSSKQFFDLLV